MALADFSTGLDLLQYSLKVASEPISATGLYSDDVKAAIRSAYFRMLTAEKWPFAIEERYFNILPPVTAHVISIIGSTVTLSAAVATSLVMSHFILDSDGAYSPYKVVSHTAGTAIVIIDSAYATASGVPTTGPCKFYFSDVFLASDAMAIWGPIRVRSAESVYGNSIIEIIPRNEFERKFFRQATYGANCTPTHACEIGYVSLTDERRVFRLGPMPESMAACIYDATIFKDLDFSGGAADIPVFRREDRAVLAYAALYDLLVGKDDSKAEIYLAKADGMLSQMKQKFLRQNTINRLVRA